MKISPETLDRASAYKLLTGVVVPRPIAWVSTISKAGTTNVAPFSCFTFVSADPPMVGFNCGMRNQQLKDTGRNVKATGEFVVNIAHFDLLDAVHASAADYAEHESEIEYLGLETRPADIVAPPLLAACPISLECVFSRSVSFGRSGAEFIVGEVKLFHVEDRLIADGKVDTEILQPLMRLGGPVYAGLGKVVRLTKSTELQDRRS